MDIEISRYPFLWTLTISNPASWTSSFRESLFSDIEFLHGATNVIISLSKKGVSMSTRSFTKEEMDILRENKYTYSVSPKTISFTIEFKKEFWKRYQAGMLPRIIVEELGYDYQMLGESRVSGLQVMIRKQATEGCFREGQHTSYAVSNHPDYSSMPDAQKLHAMEHELYYLRHEMEFLKKILRPDKDTRQEG